ncbi:peptidase, partial [Acidimangrovimonas pyrenivorans]
VIQGGGGADLFFGDRGADRIFAGLGSDRVFGGAGADLLNGGAGADTLTGGDGGDTFVFGKGFGQDHVTDFTDDVDQIKLHEDLWSGGLSVSEVITDYAHVDGNSVVLDFGNGDVLTLSGVANPSQLVNDLVIG